MKFVYLLSGIFLVVSCINENKTIEITQDERFKPVDNRVIVPWSEIQSDYEKNDTLLLTYNGKSICYQLDDLDHNGIYDVLVSNLAECPAAPKTWVHLGKSNRQGGPTFGVDSFTLYKDKLPRLANFNLQTDGPSWENDLAGFRHYLDGRNGRDVFGKQQPGIILHEVGLTDSLSQIDNYHVLEDWGRDILSVGNSLGAGGLAIHDNGSIVRLGITLPEPMDNVDSSTFRIINRGPVRAIFSLDFYGWQLSDRKINVHQLIEIWPGDMYYTNSVWLDSDRTSDTLVIGLVNNNNQEPPIIIDSIPGYFVFGTLDQQSYNREYYMGIALAVNENEFIKYSESDEHVSTITDSYLIHLKTQPGKTVSFRMYSAWELQDGGFRERDYFVEKLIVSLRE
jgi:hypothetical protein